MQSRELVKLYYRIGEVSEIVGVQPHVLRYWETEFRSIRPQKSSKGQRVYSRRDVEKLLRVKDLLRNQGFTIAGARKRLSDPAEPVAPPPAPAPAVGPAAGSGALGGIAGGPAANASQPGAPAALAAPPVGVTSIAPAARLSVVDSAGAAPLGRAAAPALASEASPGERKGPAADHRAKDMRRALLGLRQDLLKMLAELDARRAQEQSGP